MKKIFVSIVTVVSMSALMMTVSCSKENDGDVQFKATMEDCTDIHAKTSLQSSGDLNWQDGDVVKIYSTTANGDFTASQSDGTSTVLSGNVSLGSSPYKAIYPALIAQSATTIMLPASQTNTNGSPDGFPMYAESSSKTLNFKNLCGLLKIVLPAKANTTLASVKLTVNQQVTGTSTVSYTNGASTPTSGGNTITVQCSQSLANGGVVWITLPAGNYTGLDLELTDSKGCVSTLTHKNNASAVPVNRSQYTTIDLSNTSVTFLPTEGVLNGEFSVSATKKVRFSKGNLQYNVGNQTWQFAANQYDYLGSSNNASSLVDFFGYGNSTTLTFTSNNNNNFQNWTDWGQNSITNGGDNGDIWSTLSSDEWDYLLNRSSGTKYGGATVGGKKGFVILPDDWTTPAGRTFNPGVSSNNTYTADEWAAMEAAGAVFLPAAGNRPSSTSGISNVGTNGFYWTSTGYDNTYAYSVKFGGSGSSSYAYQADYKSERRHGLSVRLVYEVR